jgi:hypothetical protein
MELAASKSLRNFRLRRLLYTGTSSFVKPSPRAGRRIAPIWHPGGSVYRSFTEGRSKGESWGRLTLPEAAPRIPPALNRRSGGMADAADSKSAAPCGRVGSTPISGTTGLLTLPILHRGGSRYLEAPQDRAPRGRAAYPVQSGTTLARTSPIPTHSLSGGQEIRAAAAEHPARPGSRRRDGRRGCAA